MRMKRKKPKKGKRYDEMSAEELLWSAEEFLKLSGDIRGPIEKIVRDYLYKLVTDAIDDIWEYVGANIIRVDPKDV